MKVLRPGESTDCIVFGSGTLGSDPFPSPDYRYLNLRVDIADAIREYSEGNNEANVLLEGCPSFPIGPGVDSCVLRTP